MSWPAGLVSSMPYTGRGATIAAQLWHQGAERADTDGVVPVSPSGIDGHGNPKGRALQRDELSQVVEHYARAAACARDIGFDAVELHGAHGYLLDEFSGRKPICAPMTTAVRWPREPASPPRWWPGYGLLSVRSIRSSSGSPSGRAPTTRPLSPPMPPNSPRCWPRSVTAGVDIFHPSTRRHYVPAFPDSDSAAEAWRAGSRR